MQFAVSLTQPHKNPTTQQVALIRVTWPHERSDKKANKFDETVHKKGNVAIAVSLNIDFKNLPEIIPKCFPGAPWRCSGTSPEPPGARSSPLFRQSEESKTNWNASGRLPGHPGRPPEIQGGPENRRRINFRWKKRLPELFLHAFLLHFLHFF